MKSSWAREIRAVVRKEFRSEMRHRSAVFTGLLLSLTTVFTMAFAFYGRSLTEEGFAGMLWAALLFAGAGTLSRAFVAEEEQGTGDLLRMWARPHAVFWGKAIAALILMSLTSLLVSLLFLMLTGIEVTHWLLFAAGLLGGSVALAGIVTFASAIISRGSNRSALAGVVSLPQLLPLVALGVAATRAALGVGSMSQGWSACSGIWLYSLAVAAVAPHAFAAIWREP